MAAEALGVTDRTIRRLIARGVLEALPELDGPPGTGRRLVTIQSVGAEYTRRTHQPELDAGLVDVPTGGRL